MVRAQFVGAGTNGGYVLNPWMPALLLSMYEAFQV